MPKLSEDKITKRLIDRLAPDPDGRDRFHWDRELRGFGVRVLPSGSASYLVQYLTPEGRTRRLAFAKVGALTPDEARAEAKIKLGEAEKGKDPSADRHKARHALTVSEVCDLYAKDVDGRVKASTLAMDKSRIETHVKPLIGRRAAVSLTLGDIERLQADIAAGRSAKARKGRGGRTTGGKGVAARTVGMLGTILEWAKRHRIISENPARGVRKFPDVRRRRFLSAVEVGRLGEAMRVAAGDDEAPISTECVRFLLCTGLRRMEALALPWEWVDLDARCLRLGDSKSGYSLRPLGIEAARLLSRLPRSEGSKWVFWGADPDKHLVGLPKALDRLCKRAGLADVSVHTLRHTHAAMAAEMGFSELTIAGLLGHRVAGVTARYAHVPDPALLVAADRVSARIAAALDARADAEVVSLSLAEVRALSV